MAGTRKDTVIAIDLLRCFAAGLVVLHHFGTAFALAPGWQAAAALNGVRPPADAVGWTWSGWVGVEIFFLISGQVIAASASASRPADFLQRRAWRLLPAAWLCASLTAAALTLARPDMAIAPLWARTVSMLPTVDGIDHSYWTLSIEWAFYAFIAAVLTGGGNAKRLERFAVGLGLASAGFWAATPWLPHSLPADFGFQMTLLPHGCFFALGVLMRKGRGATLVVVAAACAAEIAFRTGEMANAIRIAVSPLIPLLLFAAAVAVLATDRPQAWLERRVGTMAAIRAAAVTYPLYLLHQTAGAVVAGTLIRRGLAPALAVGLAIGAVIVVACVVAWHVEPAVGRLRRTRAPRADTPPTASLPSG